MNRPPVLYKWQRLGPEDLHYYLREVWALVSERPGIPLRAIAAELNITVARVRMLVGLLKESGTLAAEPGISGQGTLRAAVPLLTARRGDDGHENGV